MRILCLIPAMGPGGAERAMARLVSDLVIRHDVSLLTYEAQETAPFYPLPPAVEQTRLDLLGGQGLARAVRLLRRPWDIRCHVRAWRPDVVLSFMETMNITAVAACLGTGVPVVVSERVDPRRHPLPWIKRLLRALAYPLAKRVVVQTGRIRRAFPAWMRTIAIIPNPAPLTPLRATPDLPGAEGRFRVIAVGRLDPQKGFDLLIDAFAAVAARHPDWDLVIFGEGGERAFLEARVAALGLTGRVFLPGLTTEPDREMAASHILGFSSRYEGFPNALAEAMAIGLPALALEEVSGVEDLVVPERTGLLVGADAKGMDQALERLMADPALRRKMGQTARLHATNWSPRWIHAQWETLLSAACRSPGR